MAESGDLRQMNEGCDLRQVIIPPAQSIVAEGLAALGLQGRTVEQRMAISEICKEVRGKASVHDLCEVDFPKLVERAKGKMDKLQRARVLDAAEELELEKKEQPRGKSLRDGVKRRFTERAAKGGQVYQEEDVNQLLTCIASSSAAGPGDVRSLQAKVPELVSTFKPPCKRRFDVEDVTALAARLDQQADRMRMDREQKKNVMQGPVLHLHPSGARTDPRADAGYLRSQTDKSSGCGESKLRATASGYIGSRSGSFAYREACKMSQPFPMDLPTFLPRHSKDIQNSFRKSESMPQLSRPSQFQAESKRNPLRTTGCMAMQMTAGSVKRVTFNVE